MLDSKRGRQRKREKEAKRQRQGRKNADLPVRPATENVDASCLSVANLRKVEA